MEISKIKENGLKVLKEVYSDKKNYVLKAEYESLVTKIIDGNHLTFKYIFITSLLARAVSSELNPLCIQKGSELKGSYDARTFCHEVVVPFEREYLENVLGGSNEPYQNKPAKYKELSLDNATRRGNDRKSLEMLVEILPDVTQDEAKQILANIMKKLKVKIDKNFALLDNFRNDDTNILDFSEFVKDASKKSNEGESLVLLVSALWRLILEDYEAGYVVEVHPVNQAGSSSKEVSDIDIYRAGKLKYCLEVKDKDFTEHDVEHAINKCRKVGHQQLDFVILDSKYLSDEVLSLKDKFLKEGFVLNYYILDSILSGALRKYPEGINIEKFCRSILETISKNKFKQSTKEYFVDRFIDRGWLT